MFLRSSIPLSSYICSSLHVYLLTVFWMLFCSVFFNVSSKIFIVKSYKDLKKFKIYIYIYWKYNFGRPRFLVLIKMCLLWSKALWFGRVSLWMALCCMRIQ